MLSPHHRFDSQSNLAKINKTGSAIFDYQESNFPKAEQNRNTSSFAILSAHRNQGGGDSLMSNFGFHESSVLQDDDMIKITPDLQISHDVLFESRHDAILD